VTLDLVIALLRGAVLVIALGAAAYGLFGALRILLQKGK